MRQREDVMRDLMETAKRQLVNTGDLQPTLLTFHGDVLFGIMPVVMPDEKAKEQLERVVIPSIVKKTGADGLVMITDGWLKDPTNTHRIGEIISVAFASPAGVETYSAKYTRDAEGSPVFEETMKADRSESRFFRHVNWNAWGDIPTKEV